MAKKQAFKSRVVMTAEQYRDAVRESWSEAQFLKEVLSLAKQNGWRSFHQRPGLTAKGKWISAVQGDGVGFVDLILLRKGRMLAVELKVGRNKTTPAQDDWLMALDDIAGVEVDVWYPKDWERLEGVLK